MKKLSLLVFAILVLGCGTENTYGRRVSTCYRGDPAPVVVSGEHLRLSIVEPDIMFGTVRDGEDNVDPEPINVVGFRFDFDQDLKLYRADFRIKDGESLDWLPQGVVDQGNIGKCCADRTEGRTPIVGTWYRVRDQTYSLKISDVILAST